MNLCPSQIGCDPLRGAIHGRHRSVQSHRPLDGHQRHAGFTVVKVCRVYFARRRVVYDFHLDPPSVLAKVLNSLTRNTGVGVLDANNHPRDARLNQRIGARFHPSVMVARLQRNVDGGTIGGVTSVGQRHNLGVFRAWSFMPPLTHDFSIGRHHDSSHTWVGMGSNRVVRQIKGALQVTVDDHLCRAAIDAVSGTLLLLCELLHLHRYRRRLPLGLNLAHIGRRYTQ